MTEIDKWLCALIESSGPIKLVKIREAAGAGRWREDEIAVSLQRLRRRRRIWYDWERGWKVMPEVPA